MAVSLQYIYTVSYTHLDVYKRQGLNGRPHIVERESETTHTSSRVLYTNAAYAKKKWLETIYYN